MKKSVIGALCGMCGLCLLATVSAGEITTDQQKAGYALGLVLSQQSLQIFGPALKIVDLSAMSEGLIDGLNQNFKEQPVKLSDEEIKKALDGLNEQVRAELVKERDVLQKKITENQAVATKFLAENKTKPGVKVQSVKIDRETPDGKTQAAEIELQYIVVKEGTGASPKDGDTVSVHYSGRLPDGKEFDSSIKRGEPFEFEYPGPVIPGWNEALKLLKAGGKITVFLAPELAYGDFGSPPLIPPASVLIFDMELLKVTPADPKANSAATAPAADKK